jgi:predicted CXXCH cytochrome family protein
MLRSNRVRTSRRFLRALVLAALPVGALAATWADPTIPYHYKANLVCSDCHVMHASQQHAYSGGTSDGTWLYPWTEAPHDQLLRRGNATDLCLACHDGVSGIPDVSGSDANGLGDQRAGGQFGSPVDTQSLTGHSLSRNPGPLCDRCHDNNSTLLVDAKVQCTDCHNAHGNGNYRNVQWANTPDSTPQIRAFLRPGSTGIARYSRANVAYPSAGGGYTEVTTSCIDCHHAFMDGNFSMRDAATGAWLRHPATNSESSLAPAINSPNADPQNWVNGTTGFTIPRLPFIATGATDFASASVVNAATNQVFCLTCHKAHGSQNPFGLRWSYSTGDGAGCQQCHAKQLQLQ